MFCVDSIYFLFMQCLPGVGMKGLFELLSEAPVKPILLGASCSVVSQPVAETAQHWNLVQVLALDHLYSVINPCHIK